MRIVPGILAGFVFTVAASAGGDRVALYADGDPGYASLDIPPAAHVFPGAISRLVVFHDGKCVLDRGLRDERKAGVAGTGRALEETGFVEEAVVAPDGLSALLRTLHYEDRVELEPGGGAPRQDRFRGRVSLTWIDPLSPGGRWSTSLPPGRFVKESLALPLQLGAAVITTDAEGARGDFRLYGSDGTPRLAVPADEAESIGLTPTNSGAFVAVELAYPDRPGVPERAILVLDVLQGTRWYYTWSYGSDAEPLSWSIDDTGILVVRTPGGEKRFDRTGRPIGGSASGRKFPFNRIRGSD